MSDIAWTIVETLLPAVLALAGAALYLGASYLHQRAETIKHDRLREGAQEFIWRVKDDVQDTVAVVAQTYVDDIKKGREDGKLTDEEKAEAKRRALDILRRRLGDTGQRELAALVGNVTQWLEEEIEAAVRRLKEPAA